MFLDSPMFNRTAFMIYWRLVDWNKGFVLWYSASRHNSIYLLYIIVDYSLNVIIILVVVLDSASLVSQCICYIDSALKAARY